MSEAHALQENAASIKTRVAVYLGVALVVCYSIVGGVTESILNYDLLHWGFIYSNAADLLNGYVPYRETYENYGLLSSLINAAVLATFQESLVVLGYFHTLLYAGVLLITFFLWQKFSNPYVALMLLVIALCFHAHIFYPWPNYPAYVFLLMAIAAITWLRPTHIWMAGALAAFACLARHSYAVTVVGAFGAYFFVLLAQRDDKRAVLDDVVRFGVGFAVPFVLFLAYIADNQLFGDFYQVAVLVNRLLLNVWITWAGLENSFGLVLRTLLFMFVPGASIASLVLVLINYAALFVVLRGLVRLVRKVEQDPTEILLAFVLLSSYTGSLHSFELFRVCSSGLVGAVLLPRLVGEYLPSRAMTVFTLLLMLLVLVNLYPGLLQQDKPGHIGSFHIKNAWAVFNEERHHDITVIDGKFWQPGMIEGIEKTHEALLSFRERCDINTLANTTANPMLLYLVPGMKKIQREASRFEVHQSDLLFPDEKAQRDTLAREGRLLIVASKPAYPQTHHWYPIDKELGLLVPTHCYSP